MPKSRAGFALLAALILPMIGLGLCAMYSAHHVGVETDCAKSAQLAQPPAPPSAPVTLKLITFNIQALWIVGQNRPARMRALGARLTELDPDIVGFQEVFVKEDRALLIESLGGSRLKHFQYYESGMVGSGLLIASAYPIAEVFFHRYKAAGAWFKVWQGDWWAGKGVALARLKLPDGYIDFYDTHAQAGYGEPYHDIVRDRQMAELAAFVNTSHAPGNPAFLVGDMNCGIGSKEYETATAGAQLVRVMNVDSGVDHLFALDTPAYAFDTAPTLELDQHNGIRLSDHNGYMSTVQITPKR
jgi:sphingomyelin phosphodiesterase 2